jgi:hypothetical protein
MAGVMLLFAFSMSFVINFVDKKILPEEDSDLTPGTTDSSEP